MLPCCLNHPGYTRTFQCWRLAVYRLLGCCDNECSINKLHLIHLLDLQLFCIAGQCCFALLHPYTPQKSIGVCTPAYWTYLKLFEPWESNRYHVLSYCLFYHFLFPTNVTLLLHILDTLLFYFFTIPFSFSFSSVVTGMSPKKWWADGIGRLVYPHDHHMTSMWPSLLT